MTDCKCEKCGCDHHCGKECEQCPNDVCYKCECEHCKQ